MMKYFFKFIMRTFFTVLSLGLFFPVVAFCLDGRVVKVTDGDTIHVLTNGNKSVRVRLSNIDAPERGQPFGKKAKQVLSGLVFGELVHVDEQAHLDRYQRTLGTVWINESLNVNREMVAQGYAWVYSKYNQDGELPAVQVKAQHLNLGLWQLQPGQRIPPWEWRKIAKKRRQ